MDLKFQIVGALSLSMNSCQLLQPQYIFFQHPAECLGAFPDIDAAEQAMACGMFDKYKCPVFAIMFHKDGQDEDIPYGDYCILRRREDLRGIFIRQPDGTYSEPPYFHRGLFGFGRIDVHESEKIRKLLEEPKEGESNDL